MKTSPASPSNLPTGEAFRNKRLLFCSITLIFVLLLAGSSFLLRQKHQFRKSIADIPEFCLPQAADSVSFCREQLTEGQPVVLMYVHPECEMCQSEIQQLQSQSEENIQWVLASPAERDSLNKFAAAYRLQDVANLTLLMDAQWTLYNRLQVKSIPSCYVYNRQHRLVKSVQGLVKLENIIKLANK